MLRHAVSLLLCGLLVSMMSACQPTTGTQEPPVVSTPVSGQPSADLSGPVYVSFAAPEADRAHYGPLINAFNQDNPDMYVQLVTYEPARLSRESNGSATRAIVSMADTAAVTEISPEDIRHNYLVNMAPLIEADSAFPLQDFVPGILSVARQGDGFYLLPHTLRVPLLFYNQRLWDPQSLQMPEAGWTWDALLTAAEQVTRRHGDTVDVYGMLDTNGGVATLLSLADEADLHLLAGSTAPTGLDQPEVVALATHVAELMEQGVIYAPTDAAAAPDAIRRFILDERVAIWNGDYLAFDTGADLPPFEMGTIVMAQSPLSPLYNLEGYVISSGTAHPQEAWRWLKFLNDQPVHQITTSAAMASRLPARSSFAEQAGYWEQLDAETAAALQSYLDHLATDRADGVLDPLLLDVLQLALDQLGDQQQSDGQVFTAAQNRLDTLRTEAELAPTVAPITIASSAPLAPATGATVITFIPDGADIPQVERLAQDFNLQQTDIFVQVQRADETGVLRMSDIAAHADCFSWFSPPESIDLPSIRDLRPLIDADASLALADYPPALLAPFQVNTGIYGLPFAVDFRVLVYNKHAFDEAGLAYPDSTWTLDQLQVAAQQMTHGDVPARHYGFASTGNQTDDLLFFLSRLGVAPTEPRDGHPYPRFTDSQVIQAVRRYIDLLRTSSPHAALQGYTLEPMESNIYQLIQAGQVGMWLELPIYGSGLSSISNPLVDVAMAPPPLNNQPITAADFHVRGLYISAQSEHIDSCWIWLKQLGANTSWYPGRFPARLSQAEDVLSHNAAIPGADQVYAAYHDVLTQSLANTTVDNTSMIVMDYFWFFRAIDRAMAGADLEQELSEAQEMTERYLSCVETGELSSTCATQVDSTYTGWQATQD